MGTDHLDKLARIRNRAGRPYTPGIEGEELERFLVSSEDLRHAVDQALAEQERLIAARPELVALDEEKLAGRLQEDYLNFYPANTRTPFVPIAAQGPWIVTLYGAVVYDSAGYGMLGLGHNPPALLEVLGEPRVMANVMTPSFSQERFAGRLRREIGHRRGACPFHRFLCMNSGSEAVSVAARIVDIHTLEQTMPGGAREGRRVKRLTLTGSFHGRTYRAARVSHSTRAVYRENLASFRGVDDLVTVPPNDLEALAEAFRRADEEDHFFEAFYMEPVMGEGMPGRAITREFYDLARELTGKHGSLLVMDSIQAGIRAQGCLSVVDYPGFEDCRAPDCETYSKALNAGQYPLSVLALGEKMASLYVPGVYGNTMTTAPRGLELGCLVLESITEELRRNIREKGREFLTGLERVAAEFPGAVRSVSGTGLLLGLELDPDRYEVVADEGGVEETMRRHGIYMIHGGKNSIRFTPHFRVTTDEIELICGVTRRALKELG